MSGTWTRPFWLLALLGGCTLIVPFEDECDTTGDCTGGLVCVEKLCVNGVGAGGAGGVGGAGGAGGMGGETDAGASGFVLDPALCHTVYGVDFDAALADDTILIGVLMPSSGQLAEVGPPITNAVYLALDEINQSGGVLGRRFATVTCDTGTSADQAVEAAEWLVANTPIKAIIGPAASSATIRVANEVAVPNNILLISPSSTAPSITDLPDQGLVWRTAPSDAIQGAAIGAHMLSEDYQKVAVVTRDDTYGNGLREAIQASYCLGERCAEERFLVRSYPEEGAADAQAQILFALQDFEPDIVVLVAFVSDGLSFLNLSVGAGIENFILTDGTKDDELRTQVQSDTLLSNALGTAPSSPAGVNYQEFRLRYSGKWGTEPGVFNAQAYDAMYLLGYAYGGLAADAVVNGKALAAQLKRLSEGTKIAVGNANWNRGLGVLRGQADAKIDFDGASGPLNFDRNGEAPADIEGWIFDLPGMRIRTTGVIYTAAGEYTAPMNE